MVGSAVSRVIAVIRRNKHQIVILQKGQNFRQPTVKIFQCPGIAFYIAAMTVQHVKILKIGKNQASGRSRLHLPQRCVPQILKPRGANAFGNAAMRINIINRPDGNHLMSGSLKPVQQRFAKRLRGIIATVGGTDKFPGLLSDKRPSNNSPDMIWLHQTISRFASVIKPLQPKIFFMGGNLETAVGRGITNRFAAADMFFAEFLNNDCARSRLVTQNSCQPGLINQRIGQLCRKRRILRRKMPPALQIRQPGHFPMSGNRIFVDADFPGMPKF